jgi:hypothetical protein
MKTDRAATELEARAAAALKALLEQVSAVKLTEMRHESPAHGRSAGIVARVDVYGHSHTLACDVNQDTSPSKVRASLRKLQDRAARHSGAATPVVIAPYLSPEAQALCKQSRAGFLDLEGNARLTLGEFFIGRRSLHRCALHQQQPAA